LGFPTGWSFTTHKESSGAVDKDLKNKKPTSITHQQIPRQILPGWIPALALLLAIPRQILPGPVLALLLAIPRQILPSRIPVLALLPATTLRPRAMIPRPPCQLPTLPTTRLVPVLIPRRPAPIPGRILPVLVDLLRQIFLHRQKFLHHLHHQ
jgi:hypothetical protein